MATGYKRPKCPECLETMKFLYIKNSIERKQIHLGWYCEYCKLGKFIPGIKLIKKKLYIGLKVVDSYYAT